MTATASPPLHKIKKTPEGIVSIHGVPGWPVDAKDSGIVLVHPVGEYPEGEMFKVKHLGQEYWRSWGKVRVLQQSPVFPDGIEIGVMYQHTDTGIGTPFIERGDPQVGEDALECLRAYAHGEPYMGMAARRKHAKDSAQYAAQKQANTLRPGDATPDIKRQIDEAVAAALKKAGL